MGSFPVREFDYMCPKCGCHEIHTWLIAICYECGYEGQRTDFANNEQTRQHELKFRKRIPQIKYQMEMLNK